VVPGSDELAALEGLSTYLDADRWDRIVFDTAPTGHTLSLLRLPEVMDSMVGKALQMRMRFSQAVDTFKTFFGQDTENENPEIQELERMKEQIAAARELLTDPAVTAFNFVMLAEKMSVYETERAVEHVNEFDIPVSRFFVNKLLPENQECDFCTGRREMQQDNLELIHDLFGDHDIVEIPLLRQEVRGEDTLHTLAENMTITAP